MPITNCEGLELLVAVCNWQLQMLKISYMHINLKSNFHTQTQHYPLAYRHKMQYKNSTCNALSIESLWPATGHQINVVLVKQARMYSIFHQKALSVIYYQGKVLRQFLSVSPACNQKPFQAQSLWQSLPCRCGIVNWQSRKRLSVGRDR